MYLRLFTGADVESHFEEIGFPFPAPEGLGPGEVKATGVFYNRFPAGHDMGWNLAPRRQYVIGLTGNILLTMRDGTPVEVGPGDVVLAEDLTGSGHHTKVVDKDDRVAGYSDTRLSPVEMLTCEYKYLVRCRKPTPWCNEASPGQEGSAFCFARTVAAKKANQAKRSSR